MIPRSKSNLLILAAVIIIPAFIATYLSSVSDVAAEALPNPQPTPVSVSVTTSQPAGTGVDTALSGTLSFGSPYTASVENELQSAGVTAGSATASFTQTAQVGYSDGSSEDYSSCIATVFGSNGTVSFVVDPSLCGGNDNGANGSSNASSDGVCDTMPYQCQQGDSANQATTTDQYGDLVATWSCLGQNGGQDNNGCSANIIVNGVCNLSAPGQCVQGNPVPSTNAVPATGGTIDWTCVGANGGTTASCSATRTNPISGNTLSLLASLGAAPASGAAPLSVVLTAAGGGTVVTSGGEGGMPLSFSFWWDCQSGGPSIASTIAACGDPSDPANGAVANGSYASDEANANTVYAEPGTYHPKVIVQYDMGPNGPSLVDVAGTTVTVSRSSTSTNPNLPGRTSTNPNGIGTSTVGTIITVL